MANLFRSIISSVIVSMLFVLVGISLFVGDFPPSVSQFKKVYGEYKNLIQLKQRIGLQNDGMDTEELVVALEKGKINQLRKLAESRKADLDDSTQDQKMELERGPQAVPLVVEAPPSRAEIPAEWQDQFYKLRAEVFRLNQRVIELEKKKSR